MEIWRVSLYLLQKSTTMSKVFGVCVYVETPNLPMVYCRTTVAMNTNYLLYYSSNHTKIQYPVKFAMESRNISIPWNQGRGFSILCSVPQLWSSDQMKCSNHHAPTQINVKNPESTHSLFEFKHVEYDKTTFAHPTPSLMYSNCVYVPVAFTGTKRYSIHQGSMSRGQLVPVANAECKVAKLLKCVNSP